MPDYLDTSAFIKLVLSETESAALRHDLLGKELFSNTLLIVEGRRAAGRYGELALTRARAALTAVTFVTVDGGILDASCELESLALRSLDAPHLATACSIGQELGVMYCCDSRLSIAARARGVTVTQPR